MESKRKVKRLRSENWLDEDKIILKALVKERVHIIENKNTDTNTNAKKLAAWRELSSKFNNMARTPRTLQQIKAQWCIIKMSSKKQKIVEQKQRLQTGGGPPPPSESPCGDVIAVWLPDEFKVDTNEFDLNNQSFAEIKVQEEEALEKVKITEIVSEQCSQEGEGTSHSKAESVIPTKPATQKKNKKISNNNNNSAAQQIADTEIACRKELHDLQMANEKHKQKILLLKEEVLKLKVLYYKNKLN